MALNTFADKTGSVLLSDLDDNFTTLSDTLNSSKIAIGLDAGQTNQSNWTVAIGETAGKTGQGVNAVAIGAAAAMENQGQASVAVGSVAGESNQGKWAVAVGDYSGQNNQGDYAVAIGKDCAGTNQGDYAVSIGNLAGNIEQGSDAIAIGKRGGYSNQGTASVAVGSYAGELNQGYGSVAIGEVSGTNNQGVVAIAIGPSAGNTNQGHRAIAIGQASGDTDQGVDAVAIGNTCGVTNQGISAVAIGSYAGQTNQHANSIVLNASGSILNSPAASSLTIKPIRSLAQTPLNVLQYNTSTGEVNYTPASTAFQVVTNVYTGKTSYSVPTAGQTGTYINALDTAITPSRTSSKIRVEFNISFEVHQDTIFRLFRLINGVTTEVRRNDDGNYWSGFAHPGYDADNNSTGRTNHYIYIDSPNTTSAVIYRMMIQSGGVGATTFYLNRNIGSAGAQNQENAISQCILTEIPA